MGEVSRRMWSTFIRFLSPSNAVLQSVYEVASAIRRVDGNAKIEPRQYAEAIKVLQRVCLVDPEDLQMHYTMMLCYRGLGDREKAAREEKLFRRFKAEESSQSITAKRRMISPEDNNERQMIHDHESVPVAAEPAILTARRGG